jgi:hypothetical protein
MVFLNRGAVNLHLSMKNRGNRISRASRCKRIGVVIFFRSKWGREAV